MARSVIQIARLYAPHIGGVETHVSAINLELVKRGNKVAVLTTSHKSSLPTHETIKGVDVYRMPSDGQHKWAVWRWMWQQRAFLREADVVHVHDVWWWIWPVYFFIRHNVFSTFHGWEGQYPVRLTAKCQRWLANFLSQGSIHIGAWIKEFYWDKPDEVLYGGTEAPLTTSMPSKELRHAIFFGRLTSENDVPAYITFCTALKAEYPKLRITWIGDGPLAQECQKVGVVKGMVSDPLQELSQADVVLSASYLSILQAQAAGKLVVALYSHHLKQRYLETYPGSQWLVMGKDPTVIAAQLGQLWREPQRLRRLVADAQTWAQHMTWENVTDTYEQLWQIK